jgi:hypothetical protein
MNTGLPDMARFPNLLQTQSPQTHRRRNGKHNGDKDGTADYFILA